MNFRNANATENAEGEGSPLFRNVRWGEPNAVTPAPTATVGVGDRFPNSWLCYIIMFLLVLASSSLDAPTLRLLENAACVEYYHLYEPAKYSPQSSIPETDCKSGVIQAHFAILITVTLVGANFVGKKILYLSNLKDTMLNELYRAYCSDSPRDSSRPKRRKTRFAIVHSKCCVILDMFCNYWYLFSIYRAFISTSNIIRIQPGPISNMVLLCCAFLFVDRWRTKSIKRDAVHHT